MNPRSLFLSAVSGLLFTFHPSSFLLAQGPLTPPGAPAPTMKTLDQIEPRKEVNAANVGLIPQGAMVERDTSVDLSGFKTVSLLLRNPDFTTATEIADAVNHDFGKSVASALDNSRVDINVADASAQSVSGLISRVQNLALLVHTPAKIIINERTGTMLSCRVRAKCVAMSAESTQTSSQALSKATLACIEDDSIRHSVGHAASARNRPSIPRLMAVPSSGRSHLPPIASRKGTLRRRENG